MKRLTRAEQAERNRTLVLDAARRVFLARGYHGATLEQIADEAGFSKGVVYSQFDSKADLFLALLEARISERAAENARLAESLAGDGGGLPALMEHLARGDQATPGWLLLVIEFRVHAARDPVLGRRYAAAHARTVEALADVLATVGAHDGQAPAVAAPRLAELALALSSGITLEQAASPGALGGPLPAAELMGQVLGPLLAPSAAAPARAAGSARP
jgi:AcrR family transcriptional regulator